MRTRRVVERFSELVQRQFGCSVHFYDLLDPKMQPDKELLELARRNKLAKSIVQKNDIHIPIESENCLYALLTLKDGLQLGSEGLEKVLQLVDLLVRSVVISESKMQVLERLDIYLEQKKNEGPVKKYGKFQTKNKEFATQIDMAVRQADQKFPILILAKTGSAAIELAKEVHEKSPAIDFKTVLEVNPEHLTSSDDITALGNITLFIPEVAVLNEATQIALESYLRLQSRPKRSPRIIASTTNNPKELIESNQVSQGLLYLLSIARVTMPPLENRREDILELIHFFSQAHSKGKRSLYSFGLETLIKLSEYCWSGNEQELETEIKRALKVTDPPLEIQSYQLSEKIVGSEHLLLQRIIRSKRKLGEAVKSLEKIIITSNLKKSSGNKSEVSRNLGLSRSALHQKIVDLGITSPS